MTTPTKIVPTERVGEGMRAAIAGARDDLMRALVGVMALTSERNALAAALSRHGFRRCDIAACNCGSWHAPPNHRAETAEERVKVLEEKLKSIGCPCVACAALAGVTR